MPFPCGTYLNQIRSLGARVADEFDQLYALFEGYLRVDHKEDGTHGAIRADSVTATASTTTGATGAGTFGGDVTAQSADTISKCRIGEVIDADTGLSGTGITSGLHLGGVKGWVLGLRLTGSPGTSTDYEIRLFDLNHLVAGVSALRLFYYTANSWWTLGVETNGALALGEDATGKRLQEVNTINQNVSGNGKVAIPGWTSRTAPSQITSNQNNYAISTAAFVLLTSDAARDITGIVAGFDGQLLWVSNGGGFNITLKYNSGSSTAANRIIAANGSDVILRPNNSSVLLRYDATAAFWYVLGA